MFGGKYPTVAISDSFNAAGHLYAAQLAFASSQSDAAFGFLSVGVAATVGTYRFGFDEGSAAANGDLADLAAFVGLPLVGRAFLPTAAYPATDVSLISFVMVLAMWEAFSRSYGKEMRELCKVLTNVVLFVGPILMHSYKVKDHVLAASILLFAFAGIAIGGDRDRYLFGVRRENLFHYCIGVAAVGIAKGLPEN